MYASGALIFVALGLKYAYLPEYLSTAVYVAATVLAAYPTFLKALRTARMKSSGIELLVSIAVIGAFLTGEYFEAAVVSFLFLFGAYLEVRTLEKARSSLKSLLNMAPQEATLIKDGSRKTILAKNVQVGDQVVVRSGQKIPVDGTVVSGHAFINEASITGESRTVRKEVGGKIFSGTNLESGYIEVEAEKVGENTTLAKIVELIEEAQEAKVNSQRFLEKFAAYYTPGVLILAAIVFFTSFDVHLSLTFLVIACPGALVISAPVSVVAGIGKAAKNGIIIKGGEVMESFSRINGLIFDKTGTLTEGEPQVTAVKSFGISEKELLSMAAAAEMLSDHPLGRAIIRKTAEIGQEPSEKAKQVEIFKGKGLKVLLGGTKLYLGNKSLLDQYGIAVPESVNGYVLSQEEKGNSTVFVAGEGELLGVISIADKIREQAADAIVQLKESGIKHLVMLTGDNEQTAKKVARRLGINQVFYNLLPHDKSSKIISCMKKNLNLAMVGDGINDTPAMAAAHVGIAMGGAATEVTLEIADVILMKNNLSKLNYAHQLAKATVRNMKQNTVFSVGIVLLLLLGVLNGNVHLASGMLIHELSVLLVILNATRLSRYPALQFRLKKWLREISASYYFPSVLAENKKRKLLEINGCQTFSKEEFQKCSIC